MRSAVSRILPNRSAGLVYILAALLFAGASIASAGFDSTDHVKYLILTATILALPAGGQTVVILGGGIDLSVPWMMTAAATITTSLTGGGTSSLTWVIPLVLAVAVAVGTINGVGVAYLGVSPIIMTLATNVVLSGLIPLMFNLGSNVVAPHGITSLAFGSILGVPVPLVIMLIAVITLTGLLTLTPFGRRIDAMGANELATRLSGIRTQRVTTATYVMSALGAAVGGLVLLGFDGRAYGGMADAYQFSAIAVVVVGGASILGGSGSYLGTVAGVLMLTVLNSLLQVYGLRQGIIEILYGAIILVSVWLAQQDFAKRFRLGRRHHPGIDMDLVGADPAPREQ